MNSSLLPTWVANLSNVLGKLHRVCDNLANITENESALVLGSLVSAHAMLELREWRAREREREYFLCQ